MHPGTIAIAKVTSNIHTKIPYIFQKNEKGESRLIGSRLPESKLNRTFREFTFWKSMLTMSSIEIIWRSVSCIHFVSRSAMCTCLLLPFKKRKKETCVPFLSEFGNNSRIIDLRRFIIPFKFLFDTWTYINAHCHMTCDVLFLSLRFITFCPVISVRCSIFIDNIAYF